MTIHQLSVFIENKSGTLVTVLKLLKEAGIQLIAITISDTADYGICRMICSEPDKAYKMLREAGVAVSICDVYAVRLDDEPGKAADAISVLSDEDISIAYLYSFMHDGKGVLIFRTDNNEKTVETIQNGKLSIISQAELLQLI